MSSHLRLGLSKGILPIGINISTQTQIYTQKQSDKHTHYPTQANAQTHTQINSHTQTQYYIPREKFDTEPGLESRTEVQIPVQVQISLLESDIVIFTITSWFSLNSFIWKHSHTDNQIDIQSWDSIFLSISLVEYLYVQFKSSLKTSPTQNFLPRLCKCIFYYNLSSRGFKGFAVN